MRKYFLYKDVFFTIVSAWITLVLFLFLVSIGDMSQVLGGGVVLAFISIPFFQQVYSFYRKNPKAEGKRLFFSKIGYIVLGVSLGLVIVSTIFNLFYEPGWFNFTDFGFLLISYPLILVTHFQYDSYDVSKRLILYLIVFSNLLVVIFVSDILGALCVKIYRSIKNGLVSNLFKRWE